MDSTAPPLIYFDSSKGKALILLLKRPDLRTFILLLWTSASTSVNRTGYLC